MKATWFRYESDLLVVEVSKAIGRAEGALEDFESELVKKWEKHMRIPPYRRWMHVEPGETISESVEAVCLEDNLTILKRLLVQILFAFENEASTVTLTSDELRLVIG